MKNTMKLYFFYFCFGALNVVAIQMLPLILFEKGFNHSQVATLLGVVFLSAFFLPIVGLITKRYFGDLEVLTIGIVIIGVTSILIFFSVLFGTLLILILLFSLFRLSFSPIYDSYLTKLAISGHINYGFIKSGASLGFGLGMLIFTIISLIFNTSYNFAFIYLGFLCLIAFCIVFTLPKNSENKVISENNKNVKEKSNVLMYIVLICIYSLYFGGISIRTSYLSAYYTEFGYSTLFIAITTFIMIIPEIAIMPYYNRIFGNVSKTKLIGISIFLGIMQMSLYIIGHGSPLLLIITSLFNGFQIMIFFPTFFILLQKSLSHKNAALGFIINMTIQSFFVGIFSLLIIKPIYTTTESTILIFATAIILMLIAFIPLLIYHFKYYKHI